MVRVLARESMMRPRGCTDTVPSDLTEQPLLSDSDPEAGRTTWQRFQTYEKTSLPEGKNGSKSRRLGGLAIRLVQLLTVALALWGAHDLGRRAFQTTHSNKRVTSAVMGDEVNEGGDRGREENLRCVCGNSTQEALSLGCKYDSLATAWLPAECRDDELTAEFELAGPNADGSWPYYADHDHTIELDLEQVAMLADQPGAMWYSTWEWHVKHCAFYWRKQWRAWQEGRGLLEMENSRFEHIVHCEKTFLDKVATRAEVKLNT